MFTPHHVGIVVSDPETAKGAYSENFGRTKGFVDRRQRRS